MAIMRSVHLRSLDLNLLILLHALLQEQHITRAAKRSFLSQPAMSRSLGRLREMFGDLLLVRNGRTYQRTLRGDRVLQELESIVPRLEGLVRGEEFDPARSQENFRVAMTDHGLMVLMPPIVERIRAAAASITVQAFPWHDHMYEEVASGRIDMALSAETPPPTLECEVLYKSNFVCLVGRDQKIRTRRFTLKQYLSLPHVIVETWAGLQTPVDRPLAELGLKRNAVLRVPFFLPAIFTVAHTDMIATVPRRMAKMAVETADVRVIEPPREIKGFTYFMTWHARLTGEPSHAWFRDQVRSAARLG